MHATALAATALTATALAAAAISATAFTTLAGAAAAFTTTAFTTTAFPFAAAPPLRAAFTTAAAISLQVRCCRERRLLPPLSTQSQGPWLKPRPSLARCAPALASQRRPQHREGGI